MQLGAGGPIRFSFLCCRCVQGGQPPVSFLFHPSHLSSAKFSRHASRAGFSLHIHLPALLRSGSTSDASSSLHACLPTDPSTLIFAPCQADMPLRQPVSFVHFLTMYKHGQCSASPRSPPLPFSQPASGNPLPWVTRSKQPKIGPTPSSSIQVSYSPYIVN